MQQTYVIIKSVKILNRIINKNKNHTETKIAHFRVGIDCGEKMKLMSVVSSKMGAIAL